MKATFTNLLNCPIEVTDGFGGIDFPIHLKCQISYIQLVKENIFEILTISCFWRISLTRLGLIFEPTHVVLIACSSYYHTELAEVSNVL